jgi:hypothetical protein
MSDLYECFFAGLATGAGVSLMLAIPFILRLRARVMWLDGWGRFWSARNDRARRTRL